MRRSPAPSGRAVHALFAGSALRSFRILRATLLVGMACMLVPLCCVLAVLVQRPRRAPAVPRSTEDRTAPSRHRARRQAIDTRLRHPGRRGEAGLDHCPTLDDERAGDGFRAGREPKFFDVAWTHQHPGGGSVETQCWTELRASIVKFADLPFVSTNSTWIGTCMPQWIS